MLTIAIAKGRIQDALKPVFLALGISLQDLESRKLILTSPQQTFRLVFLKSPDIPTYVSQGSVDLGIVGKDVVLEANLPIYEIESLNLAKCSLCLAGPKTDFQHKSVTTVATKYPTLTKNIFLNRNEKIKIITLEGSVEIAPLIGLSDCIVDLVESGNTLKANQLVIQETLMAIYPLVVANKISYKTKSIAINQWMTLFNQQMSILAPT